MSVQVQGSQRRPGASDPAAPSTPPGDHASVSVPDAPPAEGASRRWRPRPALHREHCPKCQRASGRSSPDAYCSRAGGDYRHSRVLPLQHLARRSDLRLDRQCADQWPADSSWLGKRRPRDAIMPNVGDQVHRGDVVASVALPSQVGVGQMASPKWVSWVRRYTCRHPGAGRWKLSRCP